MQHGADSCSEQNTHITPSDRIKVTYNKSPIDVSPIHGACSSKFVAHFRHSACQYETWYLVRLFEVLKISCGSLATEREKKTGTSVSDQSIDHRASPFERRMDAFLKTPRSEQTPLTGWLIND